jgi:peptide chain release factor 2
VKSKQYWKVQKQKSQASGGLFDLDGLETDIAEFDDRMLDPEFWNNAEAAQEVINQSNQLKVVYNTFKSLEAQYEDLEVLYEMVKEDEEPEYLEELNEKTTEFTEALEKYELTMLLNGPHDKSNAILEIHPGAGDRKSGSPLRPSPRRWPAGTPFHVESMHFGGFQARAWNPDTSGWGFDRIKQQRCEVPSKDNTATVNPTCSCP